MDMKPCKNCGKQGEWADGFDENGEEQFLCQDCWEADCDAAWWELWNTLAKRKEESVSYAAESRVDTRCGHVFENGKRCEQEGNPCYLGGSYEEPDEYFCGKHQFEQGYCPGCGLFYGGIESFEFSDHHLCDNCESEIQVELEREDALMDETYATYPFDCEDDWTREALGTDVC